MNLYVKEWINHPADSKTDSLLYKLSVQLSICNKKTTAVYTVVLALSKLLAASTQRKWGRGPVWNNNGKKFEKSGEDENFGARLQQPSLIGKKKKSSHVFFLSSQGFLLIIHMKHTRA